MRGDPFSRYVMSLIKTKELTRKDMTGHMHARYPVREESTLSGWIAYGYEPAGAKFDTALSGEEPERTYLLLFMESLSPTPDQRTEMERLIIAERSDFDFELDEQVLEARREEGGKELTYAQKLEALRPKDRDSIKQMIDELYRDQIGESGSV